MTADLVTLGETMAVFEPTGRTHLRTAHEARIDIAGAETTVAIGVRRLGHTTRMITRVGDDQLGERIHRTLRAEGVDPRVTVEPGARTGLMVKEHSGIDSIRVRYYRDNSAASRLSPVDVEGVEDARLLHVTGITAALSPTARAAATTAVERAKAVGALVSFDVNYRAALWPSPAAAAEALSWFATQADILFASEDELPMLANHPKAELVITRGADGATALRDSERVDLPAIRVPATDTIGAGDALVAGYLSGVLDGLPLTDRLHRGISTAVFAVLGPSDWSNLPNASELDLVRAPQGITVR